MKQNYISYLYVKNMSLIDEVKYMFYLSKLGILRKDKNSNNFWKSCGDLNGHPNMHELPKSGSIPTFN